MVLPLNEWLAVVAGPGKWKLAEALLGNHDDGEPRAGYVEFTVRNRREKMVLGMEITDLGVKMLVGDRFFNFKGLLTKVNGRTHPPSYNEISVENYNTDGSPSTASVMIHGGMRMGATTS